MSEMSGERFKPLGSYHLRPQAFHTVGVAFDLTRFRNLFRLERESRIGGREKLADAAGVNKTTIQNLETADDVPGIDTIAKLIEAMPGLSLSEFFRQLEKKPEAVSKLNVPVTPESDKSSTIQPIPLEVENHHAVPAALSEADIDRIARRVNELRAAELVNSARRSSDLRRGAKVVRPERRKTDRRRHRS